MNIHESVSHRDALDIVFAHRNQAYGAYQLRRHYPDALGRALGLGLLLVAILVVLPRILAAFREMLPEEPLTEVVAKTTTIVIQNPPPTPLLKTPPPQKGAVEFPPKVVAPDNQVTEEKPVDVQTLLDDPRDIGAKTVDGPVDGPPSLDPVSAGIGTVDAPKPADEEPLEAFSVHKMPSFPGGEAEMFKWIYQQMVYPEMARTAGTEGSVVLTFVVGKDGAISDITVLKTPAGGNVLGKEAVRVVQSMPRWTPGEANGHPVKVRFTLPIRFALK